METSKETIRKEMLALRKKMSKEKLEIWSKSIKSKLFQLSEYRKARHVMFYVSYDNEVKTHEMIIDALSSSKRVYVPLMEGERIIPVEISGWDELEPGAYGILEPVHGRKGRLSDIELVVVPGIAFDERGYRIGHGLGCYDDFLGEFSGLKIGLAFEFQIMSAIPHEEHDVRVDKIITEERVIECKS